MWIDHIIRIGKQDPLPCHRMDLAGIEKEWLTTGPLEETADEELRAGCKTRKEVNTLA